MALSNKPKKKDLKAEKDIESFINDGLSHEKSLPSSKAEENQDEIKYVQLRLYESEIKEIDDYLQENYSSRSRPSRHNFMVEAILEKLKQ
ncbi:hypothetical protein AAG747_05485 [Rapidithrix thailandica]|uniref:Uncharacterized protein n=1 Tax=Rapidithrix thailandica TaxID=413964 RepID=A0AAW9S4P4_9BACT